MQNAHIEKKRVRDITGVILAGGTSKRMGRDKATLEVDGRALFDRVREVLQAVFRRVLIAGERPDLARPGVPFYPDTYPGSALGGIFTGLKAASTPWIFVAPCDMPYPDPRLIRSLLDHRGGVDVVVPRTRYGLEPLFALYAQSCLPLIRSRLERGDYPVFDLYPRLRVRHVEEAELPEDWRRSLVNLNTQADLQRLTKR